MASTLKIHLVRHGQSAANLDKRLNATIADHAVELSPAGHEQAAAVGTFLANYYVKNTDRLGVYVSPYRRTRQTWQNMRISLIDKLGYSVANDIPVTESIFLRELEFGLFDGIADEDLASEFPREHRHYAKQLAAAGEFFARMPSGESRADVALRVHQFFGTLHRDAQRHGLTDAIVVTHGVTIRAFAMMWLGKSVEWFDEQRNPKNCSVRTLEGECDLGPIFAGFDHARASSQDAREEQAIP